MCAAMVLQQRLLKLGVRTERKRVRVPSCAGVGGRARQRPSGPVGETSMRSFGGPGNARPRRVRESGHLEPIGGSLLSWTWQYWIPPEIRTSVVLQLGTQRSSTLRSRPARRRTDVANVYRRCDRDTGSTPACVLSPFPPLRRQPDTSFGKPSSIQRIL